MRRLFRLTAVLAALWAAAAALSCGEDQPTLTSPSNRAPARPFLPSPEDSSTYARETLAVSWECSDPDGDILVYSVQVREGDYIYSPGQTLYKTMDTGFFLQRDMAYSWRVIASDGLEITEGPWWTFFTPDFANEPPFEPSDPSPADGSTDVQISGLHLTWSAGDPDEGDVLTFTVFFGTAEDPPLAASGLTETSWALPVLEYDTRYYWYVVATDSRDESTAGALWSFSTRPQPGGLAG
jgi:hypothetical protein